MTLGERIVQTRKQAGLSQEQLGEKLGVSRQAVSKWESSQANPDVAYLAQLCRLFSVSADWLLLGEENADFTPARCPACGAVVTGLEKFCPNCGLDLLHELDRDRRYSLVLSGFQDYDAAAQRLVEFYSSLPDGHGCTLPPSVLSRLAAGGLSKRDVKDLFLFPPSLICRNADYDTTRRARDLLDSVAQLSVYPAEDLSALGPLSQRAPIPHLSSSPLRNERKPMGFWTTVLAVLTALVIPYLLLSLLTG